MSKLLYITTGLACLLCAVTITSLVLSILVYDRVKDNDDQPSTTVAPPITTQQPGPTITPAPSKPPQTTKEPVPTQPSQPTEKPTPTELPPPTEKPTPTELTPPTEKPTPTELTPPTEKPTTTELTAPTEKPSPSTEGPTSTQSPQPTEKPTPTEPTQPTHKPTPSTEGPTPTQSPHPTKKPTPTEPTQPTKPPTPSPSPEPPPSPHPPGPTKQPSTTEKPTAPPSTTKQSTPLPTTTTTTTTTTTLPPPLPNDVFCPNFWKAEYTETWENAATLLIGGLDERIDPCEDFYGFSCNTFLKQHNLTALGRERITTYEQAQEEVNGQIAEALVEVNLTDTEHHSLTERIVKTFLEACVWDRQMDQKLKKNYTMDVLWEIKELFGGIPFLNHTFKAKDLFAAMGKLEQNHALGTLFGAMVSVDYKNVKKNAFYLSQPSLPMPRDFYVLPQFADKIQERTRHVTTLLESLAEHIVDEWEFYKDLIEQSANEVVALEAQIAMASWSDSEMRNFALQYNNYTLEALEKTYPSINWTSYLTSLLSSVEGAYSIAVDHVVLSQPSYFGWLNEVFSESSVTKNTVINYLITQLLFEEAWFLGKIHEETAEQSGYIPYVQRRGQGVTRVGQKQQRANDTSADPNIPCVDFIITYMPFGAGYVYVKSQEKRKEVARDIEEQTELIISNFLEKMKELTWMSGISSDSASEKAKSLIRNYGWPIDLFGDFVNYSKIDAYHKEDYAKILVNGSNYYSMWNAMKKGYMNREMFRLLLENGERNNFLMSPAFVNAWYQPERNSITLPYALWNPPYYNIDFPDAYNFGGHGGVAGHELVHGFDDEGIQFGPDGSLVKCSWQQCGWLDKASRKGFIDMAQCVVTQYSTQCCPLTKGSVHCANGATTQGENLADVGGRQAAYFAYQQYVKKKGIEEKRLPSLERYTPNQIFWIAYGLTWCVKQEESILINQLLTNPHAPGQCRVNQVVQDIPSFAKDFNCRKGQAMYPIPEQRCKVWVNE